MKVCKEKWMKAMRVHFSTENNVTWYKVKPYVTLKKKMKFDKLTLSNCLLKQTQIKHLNEQAPVSSIKVHFQCTCICYIQLNLVIVKF